MPCNDVFAHAHFHTKHHVGVFCQGAGGSFRLGIVNIEQFGDWKTRQTCYRNVHKGKLARARGWHDEPAEGSEIIGTGVACRHHGGGALVGDQLVCRNTNGGTVRVGVAVQVNQAWCDQSTTRIHHALCTIGCNGRRNRFNQPEANANVPLTRQALARVQYIGIANQ